jgi:hypothetical protein
MHIIIDHHHQPIDVPTTGAQTFLIPHKENVPLIVNGGPKKSPFDTKRCADVVGAGVAAAPGHNRPAGGHAHTAASADAAATAPGNLIKRTH